MHFQGQLPPLDTSQFQPITTEKLIEILGLTIKRDEINKLICFLAQLSTYTTDSQLNISFNAQSSTGKSFIPIEIAKLFPKEDVIEVAYVSPMAFFHDYGYTTKRNKVILSIFPKKSLFSSTNPILSFCSICDPCFPMTKRKFTSR